METIDYNGQQVETIDLTPTWPEALRIYLFALENGTTAGKRAAMEGLEQMAKVAQMYVELTKQKVN